MILPRALNPALSDAYRFATERRECCVGRTAEISADPAAPLCLPATYSRRRRRTVNDNKAVTDRRLRPRCCNLGSYFKRPKSSPVRPLACNWYYCAGTVYSQVQGCVCIALQLGGDVEQPWLMTSSRKPEV